MKKTYLLGLFFILLFVAQGAKADTQPDSNFNPNYIISDFEILDSDSMSLEQIQSFLVAKNSYLANYSCVDPQGKSLTAAQTIFNIAITNGVNPKFLLVLLQKEQGLVEDASPTQGNLDWATGYGCPDGGGCNERWRGFWKQLNSASLQFRDYLDNPHLYTYKQGQTYTFTNPYSTTIKADVLVTPSNAGTAALYNYTPHVYNGNYNFWKLWNKYFKGSLYPNGTLLQVQGESGVWLIQYGQRRAFLAKGALTSRFDINKIITVKKEELSKYSIGAPIKFPQYSIVRSPDNLLYLLVDDSKRMFDSKEAFKRLGYNPAEIMAATAEDLASYTTGAVISVNDAYPTGALLQDKKTGGVYWAQGNTKAPLTDPLYLKVKFKKKKIIQVSAAELAKLQTVAPVRFTDGELIKIENGFTIYVVENGALRPIASAQAFDALGYKKTNIINIPIKLFLSYPIGQPVGQTN